MTELLKHAGILCAGGFWGRPIHVSGVVKDWKSNWGLFLVFCQQGWNLGLDWGNQLCFCRLVPAEPLQPCCCWESECRTWFPVSETWKAAGQTWGFSCCSMCTRVGTAVLLSLVDSVCVTRSCTLHFHWNPPSESYWNWIYDASQIIAVSSTLTSTPGTFGFFSPSLSWSLSFRISLNLLQGWLGFVVTSGWY